jgi:Mn-dependent DtxR family transcriptional regulator
VSQSTIREIVADDRLTPVARLLGVALVHVETAGEWVEARQGDLAELIASHRTRVPAYMRQLERAGWVEVRRAGSGSELAYRVLRR